MDIEDDNISGSAVLTEKALHHLKTLADKDYDSREEFISLIKDVCIKIIQSQESMASLRNEFSHVIKAAREADTLIEAKKRLKISVDERLEYIKKAEAIIIQYGASLIREDSTVLTHSRSSTVEKILFTAFEEHPFHVIVTEGRPNFEGRLLAETLADHDIPVTFVVDAAATLFNPDIVLVGADSVTPKYVINKVGTKFLAVLFPTYVACSTNKFTTKSITIEKRNPAEVMKSPHKNITVRNYYFDGTPLEYIKGFITEYGILPAKKVKSLLE
jgi:ribose 1,5-bisphosphate isomerase